MLAADSGLGTLIWTSRLYFRIDWMFAGIVTLGCWAWARTGFGSGWEVPWLDGICAMH